MEAVVEVTVKEVTKYFFSKLHGGASREELVTRLEWAVLNLDLALERSRKLPITDVALLRERKFIKGAYIEGKELLRMHKQLEGREEVRQVATSSSFLGLITRGANMPILSRLGFDMGNLSSSSVKRLELFVERANKFVDEVIVGISHRREMIRHNPLIRLLFEGKTLRRETWEGTFLQSDFAIWATPSPAGVQAYLVYIYADPKMPENTFSLALRLRLSESTNIFWAATKCMESLASEFKIAAEFAIGKLSQQATATSNLLELLPSTEDVPGPLKRFVDVRYDYPPPPVSPLFCVREHELEHYDNTVPSPEFSHILIPEEVEYFEFNFRAPLQRAQRGRINRSVMLPLEVQVIFSPYSWPTGRESFSYDFFGRDYQHKYISIDEVLHTVGSTAMQCFLQRPELTYYGSHWYSSKRGGAEFNVTKPTTRRRSAKRKR